MRMTKAQPSIAPNTEEQELTQTRETLKLNSEPKEAVQPLSSPPNNQLFDIDKMSIEEKEQKAKEWGHIPKNQFRGDQSKYIDTDEFLKVSERKMPALKHQIKKQDDIIASLRSMNESLNENIEQQKADLTHQMQEASDNQDLVKFKNLEKREAALEKKQENMQANLNNLENSHHAPDHSQAMGYAANQWTEKNNWYSTPKNQEDFAKRGFADKRFSELTEAYPNTDPSRILEQVDADLNKFIQPTSQSYNYNPGGSNAPMGQPPSKDKTIGNLTESSRKSLDFLLTATRSKEEKERFTKNYLSSSTNDSLFKWHKSNN